MKEPTSHYRDGIREAGLASAPRPTFLFPNPSGLRRPGQALIIEAVLDGRLDDPEVRREVEVGRCVEAVVADMQDLVPAEAADALARAGEALDARQDRVVHAAESLGDQRRADGACGLAR